MTENQIPRPDTEKLKLDHQRLIATHELVNTKLSSLVGLGITSLATVIAVSLDLYGRGILNGLENVNLSKEVDPRSLAILFGGILIGPGVAIIGNIYNRFEAAGLGVNVNMNNK